MLVGNSRLFALLLQVSLAVLMTSSFYSSGRVCRINHHSSPPYHFLNLPLTHERLSRITSTLKQSCSTLHTHPSPPPSPIYLSNPLPTSVLPARRQCAVSEPVAANLSTISAVIHNPTPALVLLPRCLPILRWQALPVRQAHWHTPLRQTRRRRCHRRNRPHRQPLT